MLINKVNSNILVPPDADCTESFVILPVTFSDR